MLLIDVVHVEIITQNGSVLLSENVCIVHLQKSQLTQLMYLIYLEHIGTNPVIPEITNPKPL